MLSLICPPPSSAVDATGVPGIAWSPPPSRSTHEARDVVSTLGIEAAAHGEQQRCRDGDDVAHGQRDGQGALGIERHRAQDGAHDATQQRSLRRPGAPPGRDDCRRWPARRRGRRRPPPGPRWSAGPPAPAGCSTPATSATLTAVSRRTLLANRTQSSSVTTRPVARPLTVATAGPPARLMPMGTHRSTRNRVPCRMPQAMDPNSHSPRNRNVPMAMSSSATTTKEMAARTRPMMMPRSWPVTDSSALSSSICAWARPRALVRTRPMDSATPGASGAPSGSPAAPVAPAAAFGSGRSVSGSGLPGSAFSGDLCSVGRTVARLPRPVRIAGQRPTARLRRIGPTCRAPPGGRSRCSP